MKTMTKRRDKTTSGRSMLLWVTFLLSIGGAEASSEGEWVFETDFAQFVLAADGVPRGLVAKETASNWLAVKSPPLASVKKAGQYFPATRWTQDGALWRVEFGPAQVQVDFRITPAPLGVVLEVVTVYGSGIQELQFAHLEVTCRENRGTMLGAWWNEQFVVALLGLSDRVHVQLPGPGLLTASVYPEFGMEGQRVVLAAAPRSKFLGVVEEVERAFGLPCPRLAGQWAKTSEAVRTSYLFSDLSVSNVDETIRLAKLGGFKYILIYSSTWSVSCGSYPINPVHFPRGETDLRAVVDKCHAAGLKVGLHVNTSLIDKNDPLVQPRPDARLLEDDQALLAAAIDEKTTWIQAVGSLASFPTEGTSYGNAKAGFEIRIDEELIRYRAIGGTGTDLFLDCTRGYAGTRAAPHQAGTKIGHLVERYGHYMADLRTSLKGEISDRIAGLINRHGFDMVYFDAGECNSANGPDWYWVSQQQEDVCRRVTRELLVEGSGDTPWLWHRLCRGCSDDFATMATKPYLDHHKIADSWAYYTRSFMPAQLGWWAILTDEPAHPATTPDEVEYYGVRMLALDTPVSLETRLGLLQQNGRTEEMLVLLGTYEQWRLSGVVPQAVRERLRTGEWHCVREGNTPAFSPIQYEVRRVDVPGELDVTNTFGNQPVKFRLQTMPKLASVGDPENIVLLRANPPASLSWPAATALMPGALAQRIEWTKPLDLARHRALAVHLYVSGPTPGANKLPAVLNLQLETNSKSYREYYLDLSFTGDKTIILPEATTERTLLEFRPDPGNYAFKDAMYTFDYSDILALNLRWMRLPETPTVRCSVISVEALRESEVLLEHPEIRVGGKVLTVPTDLRTGDYAEFWANGPVRVFDRNGVLLSHSEPAGTPPILQAGVNHLVLGAAAAAAAKFTVITLGTSIP